MTKVRKNSGGVALWIFLVFSIIIATVVFVRQGTVCDRPLEYSLGVIDSEFIIDRDVFLELALQAENVWEEGMGMDLFRYKPGSSFKINLLFDERQMNTVAERRAREALDKGGGSYEELTSKYHTLLSLYNSKLKQYNENVSSYELRLSKYNDEVGYYNNTGGAPKTIYTELEKKRESLANTVAVIENDRSGLNVLKNQASILAEKINGVASTYNTEVARYNSAFGAPVIFDQGEYTGTAINVYQFDQFDDLRLVLAHEFGHSLNLDHVEDSPTSIMYYMMGEQDLKNPSLSDEDISALKRECGIK